MKPRKPSKVHSKGTKILHLQHSSQSRSDVMHALVSKIKLTGHTKKAIAIFERPLTAKVQFTAQNMSENKPGGLKASNVTLNLSLGEIDQITNTVTLTYFMSRENGTPPPDSHSSKGQKAKGNPITASLKALGLKRAILKPNMSGISSV